MLISTTNPDVVTPEELPPSQDILTPPLPASFPDLEHLYESLVETPSGMGLTQGIAPDSLLSSHCAPGSSNMLPQTASPVDDRASLCVVSPTSTSLPPPTPQAAASPPLILHRIPQKVYDLGRKQQGFTPSKPIYFSVDGRPGINMGDALRERFTGLDGRDDLMLQDASSAISCRLSVRLL